MDAETGEIIERKPPFIRTAYNYSMEAVSEETGLTCPEDSRTKQEFKDEADINKIVERFGLTGELPQNLRMPISGDFTGLGDYHEAMNLVLQAQEEFDKLPAKVRERFGNDAGAFIAWAEREDNLEEAKLLGIAREEKAKPQPIEVRLAKEETPPPA
ncbi:internal scaffolding protein [Apis mellifera associated microvirus 14]|nr:internal scaffolding protein [Apis mellifera associated microvirus 14]